MSTNSAVPVAAKKNIEVITEVERQLVGKRSPMEWAGERITRFFGSLLFIAAHLFFLTGWIFLNTGRVDGVEPFDPYPFALLGLIVDIEFILLTTFVLINQKHQMGRTEKWAHLHLQLSMLTEQEVTKNMQMLVSVCRHLEITNTAADDEVSEMTQSVSVTAVAGEIEKIQEMGAKPATAADGKGATTTRR